MTAAGQPSVRILEDALRLAAGAINDVVPPDAQMHFLAAQRELLLGVAAVIEHNTQRSAPAPGRTGRGKRSKGRAPVSNRPSRVPLD